MRPFLALRKQLSLFLWTLIVKGMKFDSGKNYCEDSDKESDWEPDQEDLDTQSEQEDEDFNSPRPSKNEI